MEVTPLTLHSLLNEMKDTFDGMLERYRVQAATYVKDSDELKEPNAAVICCMQAAFAQASYDYLLECGFPPDKAFTLTLNGTSSSMLSFARSVVQLSQSS